MDPAAGGEIAEEKKTFKLYRPPAAESHLFLQLAAGRCVENGAFSS